MSPRVTPLCCGSIAMDAGVVFAGESEQVEVPSTVFLIEATETILVDTSFGDPERMTETHPGFECHRAPDQRLRHVLDTEGYAPADIDTVVLTHLDWDHCHNLEPFAESTDVVVQREELSYAADPYPPPCRRRSAAGLGRTRHEQRRIRHRGGPFRGTHPPVRPNQTYSIIPSTFLDTRYLGPENRIFYSRLYITIRCGPAILTSRSEGFSSVDGNN